MSHNPIHCPFAPCKPARKVNEKTNTAKAVRLTPDEIRQLMNAVCREAPAKRNPADLKNYPLKYGVLDRAFVKLLAALPTT